MFSIFPIIIMSTVFTSSFIMTMRNFPPFANLYYQYSFLQIFLRILFVLMVQSRITSDLETQRISGSLLTLKIYGSFGVTIDLKNIQ